MDLTRLLCLCFFILLQGYAYGQDDLKTMLQEYARLQENSTFATDTQSVRLMLKISEKYMYDQPDSAIYWAEKGMDLAVQQQFKEGIVLANYRMGTAHYIRSDYHPAMQHFLNGLALGNELKDDVLLADGLKNVSLIYIGQHRYQDAIRELGKAIAINRQRNDISRLANNYFNTALAFDEYGTYDSAIHYLDLAIVASVASENHRIRVMAYNRMGETYFHMGNFGQALQFYQKVFQQDAFHSQWEDCFAHAGLGQTYLAMGNSALAIEHANQGYLLAREMKAHWDTERALRILSEAYAANQEYDEAYHYHKLYKTYSDSIYNTAKEKEINYLHLQHKEAENQQLAQENQISRQQAQLNRLILVIVSLIALFASVIAGLVYYSSRQKNRLNRLLQERNDDIAEQKARIEVQNKKLQEVNNSKDQLFSVISHDLKSPFASIMGTFELIRAGLLSPAEQALILKELNLKVSHVSDMLNNLLYWAKSQQKGIQTHMTEVNLPSVVEEVLSVSNFLAQEKGISIIHSQGSERNIFADPDHVRIIVQNLLGNAIKFTPQSGEISITYTEAEDFLQVHIHDSGVGIAPEKIAQLFVNQQGNVPQRGTNNEKGTGLGLLLVRQFTEENQGRLDISSAPGKGSTFTVSFCRYQAQATSGSRQQNQLDEAH
jgi:signal transduction histidine kinase